MASLNPWSHERQFDNDDEQDITLQYPAIRNSSRAGTLEQDFIADTLEKPSTMRSETDSVNDPRLKAEACKKPSLTSLGA